MLKEKIKIEMMKIKNTLLNFKKLMMKFLKGKKNGGVKAMVENSILNFLKKKSC